MKDMFVAAKALEWMIGHSVLTFKIDNTGTKTINCNLPIEA